MISNPLRYSIECRKCDTEVYLRVKGDDFQCPICDTMYSAEDGVRDRVIEEDMHKLYKGAKLAGLIEEND